MREVDRSVPATSPTGQLLSRRARSVRQRRMCFGTISIPPVSMLPARQNRHRHHRNGRRSGHRSSNSSRSRYQINAVKSQSGFSCKCGGFQSHLWRLPTFEDGQDGRVGFIDFGIVGTRSCDWTGVQLGSYGALFD